MFFDLQSIVGKTGIPDPSGDIGDLGADAVIGVHKYIFSKLPEVEFPGQITEKYHRIFQALGFMNGGQGDPPRATGRRCKTVFCLPIQISYQLIKIQMLPSCGAAGKLIDHQKMISSCLTLIHGAVGGQKSGIIKQIPHQGFRGKLVCDCAESMKPFLNLHRKSFVRVHQRVIEPGLPASDADLCQLLIAHTKQRTAKHTQKRNILMGIIQYPQ